MLYKAGIKYSKCIWLASWRTYTNSIGTENFLSSTTQKCV